ncbi:MAG TPA: hypothetical protein VFI41_04630 [Gemmatimonadales bacterium]|nr:hypothetical protein [Gemmatimonadales bacterium]
MTDPARSADDVVEKSALVLYHQEQERRLLRSMKAIRELATGPINEAETEADRLLMILAISARYDGEACS